MGVNTSTSNKSLYFSRVIASNSTKKQTPAFVELFVFSPKRI